MYTPTQAIITGCVEGCAARVEWSYDPGEPMTRDYPGMPEWFEPMESRDANTHCDVTDPDAATAQENHLAALVTDPTYGGYGGELYRQQYQWEALSSAAWRLAYESRMRLNGRKPVKFDPFYL